MGTLRRGAYGTDVTMSDNETIVRDFIAAWSRLNGDEIAGYFAADGVYHNMPTAPCRPVDLPCCGVFQLEGGKIKLWRDYFDLGTYTRALGA